VIILLFLVKNLHSFAYLVLNINEVTSVLQITRAITSELFNKADNINSMVESSVIGGSLFINLL
jgi:hypothetical protein